MRTAPDFSHLTPRYIQYPRWGPASLELRGSEMLVGVLCCRCGLPVTGYFDRRNSIWSTSQPLSFLYFCFAASGGDISDCLMYWIFMILCTKRVSITPFGPSLVLSTG